MSEVFSVATIVAHELKVKQSQVEAAIGLLDEGATVPFIARYRKEATAGLDDNQLRYLEERLYYLRELDARRQVIIESISQQEKLTPELLKAINDAQTKTMLEDLYQPFRPKRRTKAHIAHEAGLAPLAEQLLAGCVDDLMVVASAFINVEKGIENPQQALDGARQILMENFAEDAVLLQEMREYFWKNGILTASGVKGKIEKSKFLDYQSFAEPIHKIPSHRALALFRGRREGILQLKLSLENDESYAQQRLTQYFKLNITRQTPRDEWLIETLNQTWKIKIITKLELELYNRLRELADEEAIGVFASNVRDLLLAAPAGAKVTLGLDPGIRTGVKAAVVDETGKLLDYATVFPFAPHNEWHVAIADLAKLAAKYHVKLISIGNGTGSRETERLVADLIKMYPDLALTKVLVSEAGASVYSASALAANELPDLDVSIRGAVSIARRLQDPLAELVKIDPKAIGVGQYQHDVNPNRLMRCLDAVVEDCVNNVGVDVNMASAALLKRVSGLKSLAEGLVEYREAHGAFTNREQLKAVPRMGEKTFQQAAGFLRIIGGDNPLDGSAVHPEAYPLVEKIIADKALAIETTIGNLEILRSVNAEQYIDANFGLPTIRDILVELEKPGRDPRPSFKTVQFKEGIEEIAHLEEGMILEGVVSNVTNFGAFVDIGVHQDGLVHISALTNRFITDPRKIVKTGDIVTVKVVEVDKVRRRIGLTMRLEDDKAVATAKKMQPAAKVTPHAEQSKKPHSIKKPAHKPQVKEKVVAKKPILNTSMADALSKLKLGTKG